jgi:GNAT superfamily N-acetyltransferase
MLLLQWEKSLNAEIVLSELEDKEFTEFLHQKIKSFNNDISPYHKVSREPGAVKPLNLILKDETGKSIGGLTANTYWDWLAIDDFYIPEDFRGVGIGQTLLKKAEEIAVSRGCKRCFLTTFKFQARVFYEKQGYNVIGKLDDYPPGSVYYWMRKDLS